MLKSKKYFCIALTAFFSAYGASDEPAKVVRGVASIKSCWVRRLNGDPVALAELAHFVGVCDSKANCVIFLDNIKANPRLWIARVALQMGLDLADDELLVPLHVKDVKSLPLLDQSDDWYVNRSKQFPEGKTFPSCFPYSWLKQVENKSVISFAAWGECVVALKCKEADTPTAKEFDGTLRAVVEGFLREEQNNLQQVKRLRTGSEYAEASIAAPALTWVGE